MKCSEFKITQFLIKRIFELKKIRYLKHEIFSLGQFYYIAYHSTLLCCRINENVLQACERDNERLAFKKISAGQIFMRLSFLLDNFLRDGFSIVHTFISFFP